MGWGGVVGFPPWIHKYESYILIMTLRINSTSKDVSFEVCNGW